MLEKLTIFAHNKRYMLIISVFFLITANTGHLFSQNQASIVSSYNAEANGNYGEAISIMSDLADAEPGEPFFKLRLGWLHYLNQDYEQAEHYYRKSNDISSSLEAREGIMLSQYHRAQWRETITTGNSIVELYPHNFSALTTVAYSHYVLHEFDKAAEYYRKALAVYPYNLEVMGYLLASYHLNNERDKAAEIYRKLHKYNPNNQFITRYRNIYDNNR